MLDGRRVELKGLTTRRVALLGEREGKEKILCR